MYIKPDVCQRMENMRDDGVGVKVGALAGLDIPDNVQSIGISTTYQMCIKYKVIVDSKWRLSYKNVPRQERTGAAAPACEHEVKSTELSVSHSNYQDVIMSGENGYPDTELIGRSDG
jgi:hypothetical protein